MHTKFLFYRFSQIRRNPFYEKKKKNPNFHFTHLCLTNKYNMICLGHINKLFFVFLILSFKYKLKENLST